MYDSCMATKTITLEIDAYNKLRAAKNGRESFSSVVRRALLPNAKKTGESLLAVLKSREALLTEEDLKAVENAKDTDTIPINPWDEEEL